MKSYKISEASFLTDIDRNLVKKCDDAGYLAIAVACYDEAVSNSNYWFSKSTKSMTAEPDMKSKLKGRMGLGLLYGRLWIFLEVVQVVETHIKDNLTVIIHTQNVLIEKLTENGTSLMWKNR